MTTKLELAEILIEAEKTGRQIQELEHSDGSRWRDYEGDNFYLEGYSYRLAPKIVQNVGTITWATEE